MVKPGYKETEIGVIPQDWKIECIKNIGHVTSGESPSKVAFKNGTIPYFKVEQLNNSTKYQCITPYYIKTDNAVSPGSLIFPKRGAAIATNKVRIISQWSFFDTNIMALTVDSKDVCSEYLYYWIIKKDLWQIADTTSVPQINNKHILPLQFPMPSFAEQQNIAETISDIDNLIVSLEKLIAKKKAIKQGAMQELLTGKKRINGNYATWKKYRLGNLGNFLKGSGISRDQANSGSIPAVRYGELYTKHNYYIKNYYSGIAKEIAEEATPIHYGDILFAASGETKEDIGRCVSVVDSREAYAGGDIIIFTPKCEIDPIFMGFLLNSPEIQKQKSEKGQGDAVVHIHAKELKDIIIRIPDYPEQKIIASILLDMDLEIDALEQKLAKCRETKQGMMQQLLTGKIRLV